MPALHGPKKILVVPVSYREKNMDRSLFMAGVAPKIKGLGKQTFE
jgi:hypothetical protein